MSDYRELVILDLAAENTLLRERNASLEADVAVYRELTMASFDALRQLTVSHRQLQRELDEVNNAYQALRESVLLGAIVDDGARV